MRIRTSLARTVVGLERPTTGEVCFEGADVHGTDFGNRRRLRARIQMIFQDATGSLNPRMRIGQAVSEPLIIHRMASNIIFRKPKFPRLR